jgi:hypothetical protein
MAMKIKGDLQVCRTVDAARRVNQGLADNNLSSALNLTPHSAYWQRANASTSQDVNLPDATTLSNGWKVVVEASGTANIVVKNHGGTVEQTINVGTAYELTLLDNSTNNGVWHKNFLEDAGSVAATRYTETFDDSSDWGSASGGYYTYTVTAATHGRGSTPIVQVFEYDGTDYSEVFVDEKKVALNGDTSLLVIDDPDCRFEGMIVLV